MAARIAYPVTTPWGANISELAATVIHAQQLALRIVAALNSMSSGGAGPWTNLEAELGLAAGQGTLLYTNLNDAKANLNAVTNMDQIDMGAAV